MILDHCVSLLRTGVSNVQADSFDDLTQIVFKLESGVTARRLDSVRTALMMIELINLLAEHKSDDEMKVQFDNFVDYIYANFKEPTAMALFKYAIKDRKLAVNKVVQTRSWPKVAASFKPSMIENSKKPKDVLLNSQYERCLGRIKKCKAMSEDLRDYLVSQLCSGRDNQFKELMAA
jgi:hypothetical protein